jgi:outer membrane protein assembly factor BamD (BamD/ComL family)
MRRNWPISVSLFAILIALTSCLKGPNFKANPDQVLFDRANDALDSGKVDIAALDFETLINTHPESEFAAKAARRLEDDPRLANCRVMVGMTFGAPCSDGRN